MMVHQGLLTFAAAAMMAGWAAPPAADASTDFKHCRGSVGTRGERGGGFWRKIRMKQTTCTEGFAVVSGYTRARGGVDRRVPVHVNEEGKELVRRYRCVIRFPKDPEHPDGATKVRCRASGARVVRFIGGP